MSDRPPAGNHETRNPKPETSSGPGSQVPGPSSSIRLPLVVIKGLPVSITERIVSARQHGPFRSLPDFIRRCGPSESELDLLILAGALDSLGMSRPELLWLAQQERKAGLRHSTPKKRRGGQAHGPGTGAEGGQTHGLTGGQSHGLAETDNSQLTTHGRRQAATATDPETGNPKPESSSDPWSPVPGPGQAMGLTSQLPFDESARLEEFRRRMAGRLDDYDELKLCALEMKHYGMLVRRHPLSLYANLVSGLVDAREMPRYAGRWVRMLGWCIATKRVDLSRRRQVQDMIELQAANHDEPEQYTADEDELSVSGIGGSEDYELNDTAADLGLVRRGGMTDDQFQLPPHTSARRSGAAAEAGSAGSRAWDGGPEQSGQQEVRLQSDNRDQGRSTTETQRAQSDTDSSASRRTSREGIDAGDLRVGMSDRPPAGNHETRNPKPETSSAPGSQVPGPAPSRNRGTDSHTMGGFIGPGNSMKFMSMEDLTGTFECTLRADKYARYAPLTRYTGPFLITGKVEEQFGTCTLSIQELKLLRLDEFDRLIADDADGGRRKGSKPASYAPQESR
ncbi:MAG: hypothetical protein R3F46_12775 [bacterium]